MGGGWCGWGGWCAGGGHHLAGIVDFVGGDYWLFWVGVGGTYLRAPRHAPTRPTMRRQCAPPPTHAPHAQPLERPTRPTRRPTGAPTYPDPRAPTRHGRPDPPEKLEPYRVAIRCCRWQNGADVRPVGPNLTRGSPNG